MWISSFSLRYQRTSKIRTFCERFDVPTAGDHVGEHDARVQRDADDARPPTDQVSNEVNLLLAFGLGPETDTTNEERPVDRTAGVRVRRSETGVVLQHQDLKLCEFFEEAQTLGLFGTGITSAVLEVVACIRG